MFLKFDEFWDPHLRTDRYLSLVVKFGLWDVSCYPYDRIYNLHHYDFEIAIINGWAKQLSSAFISTKFFLRCAMTESGLPLLLTACLPNPRAT